MPTPPKPLGQLQQDAAESLGWLNPDCAQSGPGPELDQQLDALIAPAVPRHVQVRDEPTPIERYAMIGASVLLGIWCGVVVVGIGPGWLESIQVLVPILMSVVIYYGLLRHIYPRRLVWQQSPQYLAARREQWKHVLRGASTRRMQLEEEARQAAKVEAEQRRARDAEQQREREAALRAAGKLTGGERWTPLVPLPRPGAIANATVPHQMAEEIASEWLMWLGRPRAFATTPTRDGGIDVEADGIVAQVKWQAKPVPPAHVQQIYGVAHLRGDKAAFFAGPAGYSAAARQVADQAGVLLFVMDDIDGTLRGATKASRQALIDGLADLGGARR
ncbi:restriction endonuclease [Pseudactinotalea terrae]|uniref:restriction endonuclease n=1 Tax=Pseudactinotalea terrae TaxID=1743262 RepID=UPI0012E0FB5E|nr:restriction endonuclease [Pseudactinotalea terrae]